jgi:hypothetical protein
MATVNLSVNNASTATETLIPSVTTTTNLTHFINFLRFNGPLQISSANARSVGTFSGAFRTTTATNTFVVSLATLNGTATCNEAFFSYIKIG